MAAAIRHLEILQLPQYEKCKNLIKKHLKTTREVFVNSRFSGEIGEGFFPYKIVNFAHPS